MSGRRSPRSGARLDRCACDRRRRFRPLRGLATVAGLALCLASAGCPPRYAFGPDAYHDASDLLVAMHKAQAAPDHVTGQARVDVGTPKGHFGAEHFIAARRPGELHLETLGFFGSPLALVVVDQGRLTIWDLHDARAWQGPATARTLGMVAPVDLGPDQVVAMLLGTPALPQAGEVTLHLDQARHAYRLEVGRGPTREVLLVDPHDDTLRRITWYEAGKEVARLTYGRYRRAGRALFPYDLTYRTAAGASVSVSWEDVTLDGKLDPALFRVTLPGSVTVTPLGGGPPPDAPPILPPAKPGKPGT